MQLLYAFPEYSASDGHLISRSVVEIEGDLGTVERAGRVRCGGCKRTQIVNIPIDSTVVGEDYLTDAAARLLHICGCGGRGVVFTDS